MHEKRKKNKNKSDTITYNMTKALKKNKWNNVHGASLGVWSGFCELKAGFKVTSSP